MKRYSREVELSTGVRMPYLEQGDPAGIALVLIHAVGDSQHIFEGLLAELPGSIHAFAPTMRGHGEASRPEFGYRSTDFASDIFAFMVALHIKAAVIAGGSSGGLVGQQFAINFPEHTLGLALLGAPLTLRSNPFTQELWNSTISKLVDPNDPAFIRQLTENTLYLPATDARVNDLIQESLKVPAFVWRETLRGILEDDFSSELTRITAPTLIIYGDADALLPRADQENLARLIKGAQLIVYPQAGHIFYWEAPARVADDLARFIEGLTVE